MNKGLVIGLMVILFVVVGGGVWYVMQTVNQPTVSANPTPITQIDQTVQLPTQTNQPPTQTTPAAAGQVKEFIIEGGNFAFTPASMTVNKGDTVRIVFKNTEGFHDLVIDEFDVATSQIGEDEEEEVEFVADKAGSFEFYCSVGQHRKMGMVGTLVVN